MHVKTNIEHNIIQIVVIAICPLLLVMENIHQALFFVLATIICFFVSALVCYIFNKFLSRNLKIFITAILSTFIITLINELLKDHSFWGLQADNHCFFAVLSTICLCVDIYFIDTKALVSRYFPKLVSDCLIFAAIAFIYTFFIELFGYGTAFGKVTSVKGTAFFRSITFKLIWLGIVCIIADALYRIYMKYSDKRRIIYQKYVKRIRDEKEYQYNELRKKKLLTSPVEIKYVNGEKAEEISQKSSENASLAEEDVEDKPSEEEKDKEEKPNKRKRRKVKLSKETKVEKLYDTKKDEGGNK